MAFISTYEVKNITSNFKYRRAIFGYQDKNGKERYVEGLDIKFEIESAGGQILPQARIDVCNLDTDTMKHLTTITPFDNNHKIALYIGYETNYNGQKNTKLPKIFEGNIKYAMFTFIPDMWLEMHCVSDNTQIYGVMGAEDSKYVNENINNVHDLVDWVITKKIGRAVQWNEAVYDMKNLSPLILNSEYYEFSYNVGGKTPIQVLQEISRMYNLSIWGSADSFKINPSDRLIKEDINPTVKWAVNVNSGMIGIPTVSVAQAEVTILMNPNILAGDCVELKSERYNNVFVKDGKSSLSIASNGRYTITKINHKGHLRGNEWYSKLSMVRGGW